MALFNEILRVLTGHPVRVDNIYASDGSSPPSFPAGLNTMTGGSRTGNIYSGNFTPTISIPNGNNVADVSGSNAFYFRVGNVVLVTYRCSINCTLANQNTNVFRIVLPIASTFASAAQLGGFMVRGQQSTTGVDVGSVAAFLSNNSADVQFYNHENGDRSGFVGFAYEILT